MASLTPIFTSLKEAQTLLALHNRARKDAALTAAAGAINENRRAILAANAKDTEKAGAAGMKEALIDRLLLNDKRIDDIISGIETVARLDDPIGRVKAGWETPDGLFIEQITVPLGVAAIIYESRPNVSADAASLAYKAGCAVLLRGSSAALESNRALVAAIKKGLAAGGGIADAVALADSGSRGDVDEILTARGFIDVVLPRGGHDLIRRVVENARIPVIETGEGNCHIYVDESADIDAAVRIIENAKLQKPGACNAAETLLVHRSALPALMPTLAACLAGKAELRCDAASKAAIDAAGANSGGAVNSSGAASHPALVIKDATEEDWAAEFLDYILAVKTVDSLEEAIVHINRYGTQHSEAILTGNLAAAEEFCRKVDAACVYVNASTRFTDGGEFGMGAELGISTQKFHARGPMGLEALTAIKYRITGNGHVRK
ncbi:MAG: glutamate-5-semialdehyde dehydrogenase [Spirochaetaceae bacterium]|jgi:glutamate-5-semialdehyde dehydrogenase|nr:glutamate-5-semialdehyde dehydrogenase [Spirochaetaceae bacterium]